MASTQDKPLATVREPLDYDKGYDVIDTRTGETLAWRGSRIQEEAFASCMDIAAKLNETYPVRHLAPAHDTLVHEIVGWRIQGVAG